MKTIIFDIPKKVKKKLQLEDVKLPINRAPNVLGLFKEFATTNKMAITVGIKIIDANGEEEIADKYIIKQANSSNLLLLLRESLYSERYSEFPTSEKEKFLQEVENDLNVPSIEEGSSQPTSSFDKKTPSENKETNFSPQNTEFKDVSQNDKKMARKRITPAQLFIILDILVVAGFLAYLGFYVFALALPVVSLVIFSGVVIFKPKAKVEPNYGIFAGLTEEFSIPMQQAKNGDDPSTIGVQHNPKTEQLIKEQPIMTSETFEQDHEEEVPEHQAEASPRQSEAPTSEPIPPFPNNEEAVQPATVSVAPPLNENVAEETTSEIVEASTIKAETPLEPNTPDELKETDAKPSLPVLDRESGIFPTLKAGNANENKRYNLDRLDKQIGVIIEQEFQEIKAKQAFIDQLEINNHSDAMKARVFIEEIYQLQSAFEKKWTAA